MLQQVFTDWSQFQHELSGLSPVHPVHGQLVRLWRGQRAQWPLASAWERYAEACLARVSEAERAAERHRLEQVQQWLENRFRKHLAGTNRLKQMETGGLELCWAYGRHYGLITPLLDWSESPYLALFLGLADLYGFKANHDPSGRIELHEDDQVVLYQFDVDAELRHYSCPEGTLKVIDLNSDDSRLVAQKGLFTWLQSDRHFNLESFLAQTRKQERLRRLVLKGRSILIDAGIDLRQHGIDWRTVYPDLQGAALATNALLQDIV